MNGKLLAIIVVAMFVLPSVPVAFSSDVSVSNTGNIIHFGSLADQIAKDIVIEDTSGSGNEFTVEVDEVNRDQIHIKNNGGDTVNKSGPIDISMNLPSGTQFIICASAELHIVSTFIFTVEYTPVGYDSPVICTGELKFGIFNIKQYYYPDPVDGTVLKVGSKDDFRNYYFESSSEITFRFNGETEFNGLGIDLSIVVKSP